MTTKTIKDIGEVRGKTVLVRVDFNVPIKDGVIGDDNRIQGALGTINFLLRQGAKLVLFSHLSRIKTLEDLKKKSLAPVAKRLQELLGENYEVEFVPHTRGAELEAAIKNQKETQVILVENTRFEDIDKTGKIVKLESKNDHALGKYWASLGEVFVNDAFGTAHRAHASNVGIATEMKHKHHETAIGLLVEQELVALGKAINDPAKPLVAVLGGAKVSDKIDVIGNLLKIADKILIGGGMAFTFMSAQGHQIGKSLLEADHVATAKKFLEEANGKIILPVDYLCATEFKDMKAVKTKDENVPEGMMGLDIGKKSNKLFKKELKGAHTVIWNGPMGVFEFKNFAKGTKSICKVISKLKNCYSVIGGGDSASAAINFGYKSKFSHISTGGGASLEFFEGKVLPGIDAIEKK